MVSAECVLLPHHCKVEKSLSQNCKLGVSLVAQWLRIRLPMQGTQV